MILALIGILYSCQKPELTGFEEKPKQGTEVGDEATVSFSAILPTNPETKAMGQYPTDMESMHLVIFDKNGMFVETREAKIGSSKAHTGHNYETTFEVTLTVTDQPRIIHLIANCPVDQVVYGHEASIIGNMYVTKADSDLENKTEHETAYWARIEVSDLLVEKDEETQKTSFSTSSTQTAFTCIPMLRNFAQVVVKDSANTTEFEYIGFTLYNTIDLGTVAPYNNTIQQFQNFVDPSTGQPYKYPKLTYQGHALAAAELNTELEKDSTTDDGYKWYTYENPFYMYERKISVMTDEEDKWSESPPHVIIKGKYNGKTTYYKVDLVYNIIDDNGTPNDKEDDIITDKKYYNILRNFRYQFTIISIAGEGYSTVEEAINGSTSNNLAGAATTSKFTNISDEVGRIWVSYTDTTLVDNNAITLKYKYVPHLSAPNVTDNDLVADGGSIILENIDGGEVISSYVLADDDDADGFREITLNINTPEDMTKQQAIVVKSGNANLSREVRFYLKKRYPLVVECTPKVEARIGAPVEVDIKLPVGLTDDMFPLDLDIEVYDMTLPPDASMNTLPVVTGPSVIAGKAGQRTFHFVKTLEKDEYDAIVAEGAQKTIKTYWLTNIAANESRVYVHNKYFEEAFDNFVNAKSFVSLTLNNGQTVRQGAGRTVSATLVLPESDNSYTSRNIKFTLEGLSRNGSTEPFYITPTSRTVTINNLVTTDQSSTLKITAEEDSYAQISASVGRRRSTFTTEGNGLGFSENSLGTAANLPVDFSFTLSDYEPGMTVTVALDGLLPDDGSLAPATATRAAENYIFSPTSANCTLSLKTTEGAKICSVQLFADEYYYDASEICTIEQSDIQTITIANTAQISFTWSSNQQAPNTTTITLPDNPGAEITYDRATYGGSGRNRYITIRNLKIVGSGLSDDTPVTIVASRNTTRITINTTIGQLKGN